jgi:hypothetical protein
MVMVIDKPHSLTRPDTIPAILSFIPNEVQATDGRSPQFGFLWIAASKNETIGQTILDIKNIPQDKDVISAVSYALPLASYSGFSTEISLDLLLTLIGFGKPSLKGEVIENFMNASVAIQKSPLSENTVGRVLENSSTTGLGAFVGLSSVTSDDPLLLLTAAGGGIIFIGTAVGIGRALNEGLYQRVLKRLKPKDPDSAENE